MDFIIPISTTFLFILAKIIEMKFIDRQPKPLKFIVRDALVVFLISLIVVFIYFNFSSVIVNFFSVVTDNKNLPIVGTPEVFTNAPEF